MSIFATATESYSPIRLREGEYEALIPRFVEQLTNRWLWADWKPLLDGPIRRVRPDVALLAKDCSSWCVVEVELASHPESHFRDQFEGLETAFYGTHLLAGLVEAFPTLSRSDIERLIREEPPTLLCIADDVSETLRLACRDFGFHLAVGTPFRSIGGTYAIEWRRLPPVLVGARAVNANKYALRLSADRFGGRQRADLPREFPNLRSFTLRIQQTLYPVRVFQLSDSRAIYLPVGTETDQGRPLFLRPADPAIGLYELLNGDAP